MTDPLGQSQVLAYLRLLSRENTGFDIVSYEKPGTYKSSQGIVESFISGYDIRWHPLPYTKKPPVLSTLNDLRRGWSLIKDLYRKKHFDIVHCRGYIPALLGRKCKQRFGSKFIFDMRGWWADEKRESGLWNNPLYIPVYRYFKHLERAFFRESDRAVSLTHAGKEFIVSKKLKEEDKIAVIPTCVDFDIFRPFDRGERNRVRSKLNIPESAVVLVYSGSVGGNYRTDVVCEVFRTQLEKINENSVLLFLTQAEQETVMKLIAPYNLPPEKIRIAGVPFTGVSSYLMAGDLGLIFYDHRFSSIGRSPTKLGEYWACGLPFISGKGIGDLDYLAEKYPRGGYLLESLSGEQYTNVLKEFKNNPADKQRLRAYAEDYYDIRKGVAAYYDLYKDVL